ncbi:MAG: fumarylacetoacetate hydrolase family protein [Verrucomicrobiota bacterium]
MKLLRYRENGTVKPGVLLPNGKVLDASSFGTDWNESFFGGNGIIGLQAWVNDHADTENLRELDQLDLDSAIARPSKIICIGLNFKDHARETGMQEPKEPVVFFKASSAFCGPNDDLIIPKNSVKTDWEVELAIVIGKKASYVSEEDALDYVAGYALHNDYSERTFQLEQGGQWVKGKSCDTFAPFGPFMATKDEIQDPNRLGMWLKLNGETKQNGTTENFIFKVHQIVSYLSQYMSLLPGDVISTGTPAGVGMGFDPQRFLRAGDVVELGIEDLGNSRQKAVAYSDII